MPDVFTVFLNKDDDDGDDELSLLMFANPVFITPGNPKRDVHG